MAGEHYIEIRDFSSGAQLDVIAGATGSGADARNGLLRLAVRRALNAPGAIELDVPGDHPRAATYPDKALIIDWRRDKTRGIDWYREFVGVLRDVTYTRRAQQAAWTLSGTGLLSLLSWYHVLWPAGTASRSTFTSTAAESVMKALVTYNAVAASATVANGRDRQAPDYGISVQSDAAGGNIVTWTASRASTLLAELQALQRLAGGDFDLVYTAPTTREFRFYVGQLGSDKSATVQFAENLGNMDNVVFQRARAQERTVAVVGGQGQGDDRDIVVRTGANYSATNDIEMFVDARDVTVGETSTLQARGDARLDDVQSRDTFSFDVVQTEGEFYGPSPGTYTLGDLVSAVRPDGTVVTQQVTGVTLTWSIGQIERVQPEVRTP